MSGVVDPAGETAVGLQAVRQIFAAMIADGGPPEPAEESTEKTRTMPPRKSRRDVFVQIRCNNAELLELERRAGGEGATSYLRRRLLAPTKMRSRRDKSAECWLKVLTTSLEKIRRGILLGPSTLEEAVQWILGSLEERFVAESGNDGGVRPDSESARNAPAGHESTGP